MYLTQKPCLKLLLHFPIFLLHFYSIYSYPTPMNCTDSTRVCTSFLAFKPQPNQTLAVIESMFDVLPGDITVEGNGWGYTFIRKNCSCAAGIKKYVSNTTFTVKSHGGFVTDMVMDAYDGLVFLPNTTTRWAREGSVVPLSLFCGCSSGLWNYLVSYVIRDGDSVESLASRFGVSMDSIETVNGISNPDSVIVGSLYYIPLNSVPGEPYHLKNDTSPVPVPSPSVDNFSADDINRKAHVPYGLIMGGIGVGLALIIISMILCVFLRSSNCLVEARNQAKVAEGNISHKLHRSPILFCGPGRFICCKPVDQTDGESSSDQITAPKPSTLMPEVFNMDKPVVFTYEEIFSSTDGFSDSNLLGYKTYGSVYYGLLRDQEVAIKRITATKTKEFMSEMKVLCKVHHANLVEFIGYAPSHDEVFLVFEYAQKGSLSSHLHDPQNKGHSSLSWITRVQIALDAARGLEYIHEHTKTRYVHQDINTSNILLDASFRAKISDFGLAKLVSETIEGGTTTTKGVSTYGYLAPEYLSNRIATSKSDVYAFGVVLYEIISGKKAIIQTQGTQGPERRSLASIMLEVLRTVPDSLSTPSIRNHVDPIMKDLYSHDCVLQMAMLAKQCVEEDPILRPDMKQVVLSLSQIHLSSFEWEATLAGKSQVFSGLIQGR
ncbi:lysM domain receptor-like kinase 3 [Lotus japonicus]|uniref:LysM type receptor kinase n=1 Tax=Lotus japonicus TaxID=34305 RepID=D3KTZ4_LOTJA|nr:lysM domain receptor-like kinase 3 [Lotus japonicus]BAI79271.1 LysM type receptor kinase [Lotus japonicus]